MAEPHGVRGPQANAYAERSTAIAKRVVTLRNARITTAATTSRIAFGPACQEVVNNKLTIPAPNARIGSGGLVLALQRLVHAFEILSQELGKCTTDVRS